MTPATIEYSVTVLAGVILLVFATQARPAIAYLSAGLGAALILWCVIGGNVAAYIAAKRERIESSDPADKQ